MAPLPLSRISYGVPGGSRRLLAVALAGLLLAGCASAPTPETPVEWTRWVCDSQAQVLWRFADESHDTVELRIGDSEVIYRLEQEPSGTGTFYSDNVIAFQNQGDQGLVYWVGGDDLIGRGCLAP